MEKQDRKVLILEDDALQATDLSEIVEAIGMSVLGPFATPEDGMGALDACASLSCALLDVQLAGGRDCLPVADRLARDGVAFAFVTGRDDKLPNWLEEHGDRLLLTKPFRPSQVAALLEKLGA